MEYAYYSVFAKLYTVDTVWCTFLAEENIGKFLSRNLLQVKLLKIFACLLSLYRSRYTVRIWIVKYGEPPVIYQIRQDFPLLIFTLHGILVHLLYVCMYVCC